MYLKLFNCRLLLRTFLGGAAKATNRRLTHVRVFKYIQREISSKNPLKLEDNKSLYSWLRIATRAIQCTYVASSRTVLCMS